jgi:tetratricopeptide (TPR) repeat protein
MTPYQCTPPSLAGKLLILLILASTLGVNSARVAQPPSFEDLTRSGMDHYYSLEYDQAIRDLQAAILLKPDDPKGVNHLLEAVLFRELYRHGALDTSLYTQESFLNSKQIKLDPEATRQIRGLVDKAFFLSDKRLKENPRDLEALYAHGVTKGLYATYLGLVEHSWFSALRSALGSRSDHEQVLKIQPGYVDAKTVVGIHNYVVASLPLPVKVMAGITGIRGDKNRGLEYLNEAAKNGTESSADAGVALGLFLRREGRFDEALKVVRNLISAHPRNFLFALEEANLLKDSGKRPQAILAYQTLLTACKEGRYPSANVELAEFDMAGALRAEGQLPQALQSYQSAGRGVDPKAGDVDNELRQKSLLAAGQVSDLLARRDDAVKEYHAAIALDSSSNEAEAARRYLNKPYRDR